MSRKLKRSGRNSSPKRSRQHISLITFILVFTGAILIGLSLLWQYHQARILSFNNIPQQSVLTPVVIPNQLTIPDLQIDIPIVSAHIVDGIWETSHASVSFLAQSATPGESGNIVMYGHNKVGILANLKKAKMGQTIYITTSDRLLHTYQIQEIITVNPDQIELVQPTTTEILTIYTCTGFLDSKRLVIKARPTDK